MGESVTIYVAGDAVPWRTPDVVQRGKFKRAVSPKRMVSWQSHARMAAQLAMRGRVMFLGPVWMEVVIAVRPPSSWPKWKIEAALTDRIRPTTTPDRGNIVKNAEDALQTVVYLDDKQVVFERSHKIYKPEPGLTITVWPASQASAQIKRLDELPLPAGGAHPGSGGGLQRNSDKQLALGHEASGELDAGGSPRTPSRRLL